jgi:DNA-binding response OmpR family regulator
MMNYSNNKHILIIEDDLDLLDLCKAVFEIADWEVVAVSTGRQGLAELVGRGDLPDLILLDLNLPDFEGMEILKVVSEKNLDTNVLIMTGEGTIEKAVEATKLGAIGFLQKPLTPEVLLEKAEEILIKHARPVIATPPIQQPTNPSISPPPSRNHQKPSPDQQPSERRRKRDRRSGSSPKILILGALITIGIVVFLVLTFQSSQRSSVFDEMSISEKTVDKKTTQPMTESVLAQVDPSQKRTEGQKKSAINRSTYFYQNHLENYYCQNYLKSNCENQSLILNPLSKNSSSFEERATLYRQYCKRCHGENGRGNGTDAVQLKHLLGRLDFAGDGILQKDSFLFWTIAEGGTPLGTEMPAFKDFLTEKKIWKLILYINSM